jgi:hypothetical protein
MLSADYMMLSVSIMLCDNMFHIFLLQKSHALERENAQIEEERKMAYTVGGPTTVWWFPSLRG